jgi:hypothetical protein
VTAKIGARTATAVHPTMGPLDPHSPVDRTARLEAALAGLLAVARAAGTPSGHLAIKSTSERFGTCNQRVRMAGGRVVSAGRGFRVVDQQPVGECGPSCESWRRAIEAAERVLAEDVAPVMPDLFSALEVG